MRTWSLTHLLTFVSLTFLVFSCQKDKDLTPTDELQVEKVEEHLSFLEVEEGIPDRVEWINRPLILTDTSLERGGCRKEALWAHIAEIATLQYNGQNMSATHVSLVGDLALVTYHLRGGDHKGAIEVVDLKNPEKPKITGQAFLLQADVNAIVVQKTAQGNNRKIWLALSDEKNGAVLGELMLQNKKFKKDYFRQAKLAYQLEGEVSASANAVTEVGNFLYVTTGRTNGGVFCLRSSDLGTVGFKQFTDAKGIATNGTMVASLKATEEAEVYVDVVGSTSFSTKYPIGSVVHQNVEDELGGKVSLFFGEQNPDYLFIAGGKTGLKVLDISSGQTMFDSPEKMLKSGNTNGVTMDNQYSYVANGADGLAIFETGTDGLPDASHVFLWDLNETGASANFVESGNDWVFVAKGEGGFKILKKPNPEDVLALCAFDADGKPEYLTANSNVCTDYISRLNGVIPVNGNLLVTHPEFMTNGASEILLTKDTEVSLTFVEENTGLKHAIGYYAYPADCVPEREEDLVGLVAFPNFSGQGSGGTLVAGNTIKLHAKFKANTMIGFFLVPHGWTGSAVKSGQALLYTNPQYNNDPFKQGLIFHDAACDEIIVTFDQLQLPTNLVDFRDVVIQVNVSESGAVDTHDLIPL